MNSLRFVCRHRINLGVAGRAGGELLRATALPGFSRPRHPLAGVLEPTAGHGRPHGPAAGLKRPASSQDNHAMSQPTGGSRSGQSRRRRRPAHENNHKNHQYRSHSGGGSSAGRSGGRRTETAKPGFFARLLALIGLGGKKTPDTGRPQTTPRVRSERPPTHEHQPRQPREDRPARTPRPPVLHEVTSGRLYVGNLSYDTTESDLSELFGGVGSVANVEVVSNQHTQRSKGFGFVQMQSMEEAQRAVEVLHDKEFMGRKLVVSGARPSDRAESAA
jgi:hypothetical protein